MKEEISISKLSSNHIQSHGKMNDELRKRLEHININVRTVHQHSQDKQVEEAKNHEKLIKKTVLESVIERIDYEILSIAIWRTFLIQPQSKSNHASLK
ncbi:hypothetical protein HHI36_020459 [Cryptolaemus montrouzieri]|uniref:Uncharacterized protein n=1 Tax=Cryptolaemus montrouzieri TaxID=559131 RepID=A0ABD2NB23_9CUCU